MLHKQNQLITLKKHTYGKTRSATKELHNILIALRPDRKRIASSLESGVGPWKGLRALTLPFDTRFLEEAHAFAGNYGRPKHLFLVGIGGSSLGVEAIYRALRSEQNINTQTLTVLDTFNPERLHKIEEMAQQGELHPKDVGIVVVSKSGTTTETITNLSTLLDILKRHSIQILPKRIVAIGDTDNPLLAHAQKESWSVFTIPSEVGGRFSIFSLGGLIPLALLGIDIDPLLHGAREILQKLWHAQEEDDIAAILATTTFLNHEKGIRNQYNIFFAPQLETLGKWHRQLLAESSGKNYKGIYPSVGVGTTDLHSVEQRIIAGPQDTFVVTHTVAHRKDGYVANGLDILPNLNGVGHAELANLIADAVIETYEEATLPYASLELREVTAEVLGAYMAMRMYETILLCHLLQVDPFTQPGVERYKAHVRQMLKPK